jgi:hypothetical protein
LPADKPIPQASIETFSDSGSPVSRGYIPVKNLAHIGRFSVGTLIGISKDKSNGAPPVDSDESCASSGILQHPADGLRAGLLSILAGFHKRGGFFFQKTLPHSGESRCHRWLGKDILDHEIISS